MAVNPLIVFVGLSVTTLGGLVAVVQQNKLSRQPASVVVQKPAATGQKTQLLVLPDPKPEKVPAADAVPTKKLASLAPEKKPEPAAKPIAETAREIVKTPPVAKPDAMASTAPTFDMVRVEEDGGAVVVGKARPGAEVVLKLNGKIIGKTKANQKGDWVFVPDQLVPQGSNQLIVEATGKDKKTVRSQQSIIIAMPKGRKDKPLIVVSKPDAPTRVLQKPEPAVQPTAVEPAKAPATKSVPKKLAKALPATKPIPEKPVEPKMAVAAGDKIEEKIQPGITGKTPDTTQVKKIGTPVEKTASLPKSVQPTTPSASPAASPAVNPARQDTSTTAPANTRKSPRLLFGTVDYNDLGEIVFTGKARAQSTVRLYVDNVFVGDAVADKNGNWTYRGKGQISTGGHELRADQLAASGNVEQRTAVPFVRADRKKVAALLATRKQALNPVTVPTPKPAMTVKTVPRKQPAPVVPEKTVTAKVRPADTVAPKVVEKIKTQSLPVPSQPPASKKPVPEKVAETVTPAPAIEPVATTDAKQLAEQVRKESPSQPQQVSHVVIQPGNNLWNISRVIYGKGIAYTTIYQANQDQIKNPDRIYPGQIFTTPGTTSPGKIAPDQREPMAGLADLKTTEN